jgi:putative ABC transport system substrate-binding protein
MQRRAFITLLGGAAAAGAWPVDAYAQHPARIGFLGFGTAAATADRVEALRAGLRDLGYIEGKNLVIDFRWAEAVERLRELAAELVRANVDIIFATSSTETEVARQATTTIPIVFSTHFDPVGTGHVSSLARPGGNITGLAALQTESSGKALEMLTQAAPHAKKIGVLWSTNAPSRPVLRAVETTAANLGVLLQLTPVRIVEEFEGAFETMTKEGVDALFVVASSLTGCGRAIGRAGDEAPLAEHVRVQGECDRRRSHELLAKLRRAHPARRYLHRQNTEGRQTCRFAGRASDQVRAGAQHEDRKGARAHDPACIAGFR